MTGSLKNLRHWSASKRVQPTGTTFERSELGCVASIFLPPVPERRSRQPPLLSRRDAQKPRPRGPRFVQGDNASRPQQLALQKASIKFAAVLSEISGSFLTFQGSAVVRRELHALVISLMPSTELVTGMRVYGDILLTWCTLIIRKTRGCTASATTGADVGHTVGSPLLTDAGRQRYHIK